MLLFFRLTAVLERLVTGPSGDAFTGIFCKLMNGRVDNCGYSALVKEGRQRRSEPANVGNRDVIDEKKKKMDCLMKKGLRVSQNIDY